MGLQMGYVYSEEPKTRREPDWCDKAGAEAIAQRIKDYWAARGFFPNVIVEQKSFTAPMRTIRYDVRSDMTNALPAKLYKEQLEKAA
jgi:hypothetical protein